MSAVPAAAVYSNNTLRSYFLKKIVSLLISLMSIMMLMSCNTPVTPSVNTREAVVDDLRGDVTSISNDESMNAFKGLALLHDDSLITKIESWASLEFNEGQYVLIEENSTIEISELSNDLENIEIALQTGKIWVVITDTLTDSESFKVTTPTCSMSVRGTVFYVSCDVDGNTQLVVYEGFVELQVDDVIYQVSASAVDVTVENGEVTDTQFAWLGEDEAAPFFVRGTIGPGGVLEELRERLPRLVWDGYFPPVDQSIYARPDDGNDLSISTRIDSSEMHTPSPEQTPQHTHEWRAANYQEAQRCTKCNDIEGEPIPPSFLDYGYYLNDYNTAYAYVSACGTSNINIVTVGRVTLSDYRVIESNDIYEAKDGYEWHLINILFEFGDDNARNYGFRWQAIRLLDYYSFNQNEGIERYSGRLTPVCCIDVR